MPAGENLTPLLSLIGTVFSGFLLCGLWIWRQTRGTDDEDIDRLKEVENDKRGQLSAELADLYTDIEDYVAEKDDVPDEMGRDELVVNVIHTEVTEDEIEPVVDQLNQVGDAREKFDQHEDCFRDSYVHCAYGSAYIGILAILLVIQAVYGSNPFGEVQTMAYGILTFMAIRHAYGAFQDFNHANELKDELDSEWREYKMSDRFTQDSPDGSWFNSDDD